MPAESLTGSLVVEVGGAALPADVAALLGSAYVDDDQHLPALFVLRFRDPGHVVLDKTELRIGAPVALRVRTGTGDAALLMAGSVTALERELGPAGTVTEIRGLDAAYHLRRSRRVAAYPGMSLAEVVTAVAVRAGLRPGRIDPVPDVGATRHTQLSQDNVTDWEFLSRLADLIGARLALVDGAIDFVRPDPGGDDGGGPTAGTEPVLEVHRNLLSLRACVSSTDRISKVEARGWDFTTKRGVSATAVPGSPDAPPDGPAESPALVTDAAWNLPGAVHAAARGLAARHRTSAELEGVATGDAALRAGTVVELAGVGEPFAGRYTLTGTRHIFDADTGYTTSFTVARRPAPAPPPGPAAGRGLVPALVGDVRDPLGLGRVRLLFPWLADDFISGWARTVQPGAGAGRGALVLPEVGDEVLVGFAHDDLDSPYVVGGLHNGVDRPPALSRDPVDPVSGAVTTRGFVSRTGHRVEVVEDEGVVITTGDGTLRVHLDSATGVVRISGGNGVTIDAGEGELRLTGRSITATADSELRLAAQAQLTASAALIRLN